MLVALTLTDSRPMVNAASHPLPFTGVFTYADLRASELPASRIKYWLRNGEILRLRPGVFAPSGFVPVGLSRAVVNQSVAASLLVASGVHGIVLPSKLPAGAAAHIRLDRIPSEVLECRNDILIPNLEWTALSLARHQPLQHALIPLDSSLRQGAQRNRLDEYVRLVSGRRGTAHLALAVEEAREEAESALESLARGSMLLAGLPRPDLQVNLICGISRYRVDFAWPDQKVILEADGLVKYQRPEDMWAEKRRQSDLQSAGWEVWRCLWHDAAEPSAPFLQTMARRLSC